MTNTPKPYVVSTLEKGLRVLELIAEQRQLSVSQVAERMGYDRSAAHRFLSTLKVMGYVEQDEKSRYHLTSRLFDLATRSLTRANVLEIARPFMELLSERTGETANLGHFDGREVLYLGKVESANILNANLSVGTRVPAFCTGMGKSILAFQNRKWLGEYLESADLTPLTPKTITDPNRLRELLDEIRETGSAIDDEELALGISCVAAPVFGPGDKVRYALSVAGPTIRMTPEKMAEVRDHLLEITKSLSLRLGGTTVPLKNDQLSE